MSLITRLPQIMEECTLQYKALLTQESQAFVKTEQYFNGDNCVIKGDNLSYMQYLLVHRKMGGKLQLIYVDPPFFSKSDYGNPISIESDLAQKKLKIKQKAYEDTWENGLEEYLRMLTVRLLFMRELLAEDGSIWVHLDWHAIHYVKIIMDEIFGAENFINEVIWNYKSGGVSKKRFARKHDTLLFYGKTQNYFFKPQLEKSYNRDFKPYRFKGVTEYQDKIGWYTMVNMKDVWQIDMVGRTSSERSGYATQKPTLLLERILESCTRENDLCADFFGGSGTLAVTANRMNRKWLSCDKGSLAIGNSQKRLLQEDASFSVFEMNCGDNRNENKKEITGNSIEVRAHQDNNENRKSVEIELLSYRLKNFRNIQVPNECLQDIKQIMKKDSLQFVEYWGIDFDYNGEIFRPKTVFTRNKTGMNTIFQDYIDELGAICIKTVDIFGNVGFHMVTFVK